MDFYLRIGACNYAPSVEASTDGCTNQIKCALAIQSGYEIDFVMAALQAAGTESPDRSEGLLAVQQMVNQDRRWAFKTSRPRSSRMGRSKRQSNWNGNDNQAQPGEGIPHVVILQSPVTRIPKKRPILVNGFHQNKPRLEVTPIFQTNIAKLHNILQCVLSAFCKGAKCVAHMVGRISTMIATV